MLVKLEDFLVISKEDLLRKIHAGKNGLLKGLPHGFDRLQEFIPNIQQGTYYLVGAESSVGKSAFVNNSFVFNPIDYYLANKDSIKERIKVHYFSFEIAADLMLYKAVCRKIWLEYGVLLDINYILSRGKNRISEEHYKLVTDNLNYFDEMNDILDIYDIPENPTGIWSKMLTSAINNGVGSDKDNIFENKYIPKNDNLYNIIVIDHASLIRKERGFGTKELIDKMSEFLIILRNKFNYTPVVIQQLNRAGNDPVRIRTGKMEPMLSDFKDSGNCVNDCNVALTLFSPVRYELEDHRKYIINPNQNGLGARYRSLSILKNRDGEADKNIGLQFLGEIGHFSEIKRATEMNKEDYDNIGNIKKSF